MAKIEYNPDVVAVSKLAKVEIAASNFSKGKQKYFTYDQALAIEQELKDTGWRLPTRQEWVFICEEFGCNHGALDASLLEQTLGLKRLGCKWGKGAKYIVGVGYHGCYWSSTSYLSNDCPYILSMVGSIALVCRSAGLSDYLPIRLVRDYKGTD